MVENNRMGMKSPNGVKPTPPAAAEHWWSAGKSFHWRAIHAMPIATFLDPK